MLKTSHGTYHGQTINGIPNGFGKKTFFNGYSLEGTWNQGIPEGRLNLKTQDIEIIVTFKKGLISKIHTEESIVTLQFPYKYQRFQNTFDEIFDESSTSFYTNLKIVIGQSVFEKTFNKKVKNVQKVNKCNYYFGEVENNDTPHGVGIMVFNENNFYYGEFENGKINGLGKFIKELSTFKGRYVNGMLNGRGQQKDKIRRLKFIGNFEDFRKVGDFVIYLSDFRLECNLTQNHYQHSVLIKYYRKERYLGENLADSLNFEPIDGYIGEDLLDFIRISQMNYHKYIDSIKSSSHQRPNRVRHAYIKLSHLNKKKILPDVKNWLDYEISEVSKLRKFSIKKFQEPKKILRNDECNLSTSERMENGKSIVKCSFLVRDEVYVGEMAGGLRHGLGIFKRFDGFCYRGYWKNNKFHGKGELIKENLKIAGFWESGRLLVVFSIVKV